MRELYEASPFGMVSSLFYGTIQSALFTLISSLRYLHELHNFRNINCNFLLAISGAVAQFPVGKII